MSAEETISTRRSAWGFDSTVPDDDWQERALCPEVDPEMFFAEKGGSTKEAKKICGLCEVRQECLDYALDHDERFGVWGGKSERERRRIKRGTDLTPTLRHEPSDACYQRGCTSPECMEAHNAYDRAYRQRRKGDAA